MSAQAALDRLRDRVRSGDRSITGADLAAATYNVELEQIRAQGEEARAADPRHQAEQTVRDRSIRAQERRARRHRASASAAEIEGWRRAIAAGLPRDTLDLLRHEPHKLPAGFVELYHRMTGADA